MHVSLVATAAVLFLAPPPGPTASALAYTEMLPLDEAVGEVSITLFAPGTSAAKPIPLPAMLVDELTALASFEFESIPDADLVTVTFPICETCPTAGWDGLVRSMAADWGVSAVRVVTHYTKPMLMQVTSARVDERGTKAKVAAHMRRGSLGSAPSDEGSLSVAKGDIDPVNPNADIGGFASEYGGDCDDFGNCLTYSDLVTDPSQDQYLEGSGMSCGGTHWAWCHPDVLTPPDPLTEPDSDAWVDGACPENIPLQLCPALEVIAGDIDPAQQQDGESEEEPNWPPMTGSVFCYGEFTTCMGKCVATEAAEPACTLNCLVEWNACTDEKPVAI